MASTTFNPQGKSSEQMDRAKDAGNEAVNKAKQAGKEAVGAAKQAGNDAMDKAKDMGGDMMSKAQDMGADMMSKAKDAVATVGETMGNVGKQADDYTAAAGHSVREWGDNLAKSGPHGGIAGQASQALAEGIRTSGQYLEEHKLSGIATDVEQVVKNHPLPALLLCFGLGFCLARIMKD